MENDMTSSKTYEVLVKFFAHDYIWIMLYFAALDNDVAKMNIYLAEYANLNPLT